MNYLCAIALLFATLKEIWLIMHQGKLEDYTAIAKKPEDERTPEERDIVISIGLMMIIALIITLTTFATLIGLMTNTAYVLPASLALGLTIVKYGVVQIIPQVAKPAYMICNSMATLVMYGWITQIMFLS